MPPLTTQDFDGVVTPAQVQLEIVNRVLGGAPFARSLDPLSTGSGRVSWPTAGPTGGGWTGEGQPLKEVALNPRSYTVAAKKLSGVFDVTNEMLDDATFNIGVALGSVVTESLGPQLDDGVIRGGVDDEDSPTGVWTFAPEVGPGPLWSTIWEAVGELGDEGGVATTVALRPSTHAAEAARVDDQNRPLYADGLVRAGGLDFVTVPSLEADEVLVYDRARVRLVVRRDFSVQFSGDAGFRQDMVATRVIGRFAIGVPVAAKSIRKFVIEGIDEAHTAAAKARVAEAKAAGAGPGAAKANKGATAGV